MKPLYIWQDSATGEISISAFSIDSSEYEANHIMLCAMRHGYVNKHGSVLNILSNVLALAGIATIRE